MLKILKNLKQSWITVVVIIALLGVQASVDLELPDYTSKIVNIGIQQKGIEQSSPEVMSKQTFEDVLLLSKEDNLILNSYRICSKENLGEKKYNKLLKKFSKIDEQECYVIKNVDKDVKSKLNIEIGRALMLKSMLENEQTASQIKEQITSCMNMGEKAGKIETNIDTNSTIEIPGGMEELTKSQDLISIIRAIPEEYLNNLLDKANEKYSSMPDSIIEQSAIVSVQKEYEVLGADIEKVQNDYILHTGLQMLIIALISMASGCLIILLSARVAAKLGRILREKVFKKVLTFSSAEYRKFGSSSLITRNTNDIQQIQNLIPMMFRVVIYAPIMGFGGFLKVLSASENSMAWIVGVAILAIIFIVGTLFSITMPKFKKLQNLVDRLNMVSREILAGRPVIRAFNREKYEENKFENANKDLMKTNIFVNRSMSLMMPSLMFIMNAVSLLIIWTGAFKVDDGVMQVGDVMAFIQYTMQIVISFLFISMLSIMLPRASVSAKRITDVLETDVVIKDTKNAKSFDKNKKGLVEFKNVSFRYPDADAELLTDINFTAKPGEVTAIIGSTGSGKSTVVNLLPRFYDVTGGEILVDGVNIKDVPQKDLRDVIGFVPQKGVLFSGTIESNIKYSNENMSNDMMVKAAKIAQAEEFIQTKTDTYNSEISQGGNNVSGGQKQRLSIARAIAKDPEIFVFDDSFSALDFKTDLKLRTALEDVIQDKTVIIVAQRISTIMNAKQIIVLDEGKIVGKGTHEELLENNEIYKQIALSQLSKEELEDDRK